MTTTQLLYEGSIRVTVIFTAGNFTDVSGCEHVIGAEELELIVKWVVT